MHSLGFQLNVILTFNENIQIFRFKTKKEEKEEFFQRANNNNNNNLFLYIYINIKRKKDWVEKILKKDQTL